jgi:hypothetical protein
VTVRGSVRYSGRLRSGASGSSIARIQSGFSRSRRDATGADSVDVDIHAIPRARAPMPKMTPTGIHPSASAPIATTP